MDAIRTTPIAINLCGTSGAGKTTIARNVMSRYATRTPRYIDGRRRPIGNLCERPNGRALYVPGHYVTPCGGCDTIAKPDHVFALVREALAAGHDVLGEGIIIGDDVTRTVALAADFPVRVCVLNTSIEDCLASIRERRATRGDNRPLDPKNTIERAERLQRILARLRAAGVDVREGSRAEVLAECVAAFGLGEPHAIEPASNLDDLAAAINAEHEATQACIRSARDYAGSALDHARRAGDVLIQVKEDRFAHGQWLPWLAKNCPTITERTAQNYMKLARRWPEIADANTKRISPLGIGEALRLLATPRAIGPPVVDSADVEQIPIKVRVTKVEPAASAPAPATNGHYTTVVKVALRKDDRDTIDALQEKFETTTTSDTLLECVKRAQQPPSPIPMLDSAVYVTVPAHLSNDQVERLAGKRLTRDKQTIEVLSHDGCARWPLIASMHSRQSKCETRPFDHVVALKPGGGILGIHIRNCIDRKLRGSAFDVAKEHRWATRNRKTAASDVEVMPAGVGGFYGRAPREPFCRASRFNLDHPDDYAQLLPFIRAVDAVFAATVPAIHAAQRAACSPEFTIADTAFSTFTINDTFATTVHTDDGEVAGTLNALTVLGTGDYGGGELVFPKYRVAFDVREGDVLLADFSEWHGNLPIVKGTTSHRRISMVLYLKTKDCGTALEEHERAKQVFDAREEAHP